MTVSSNTDRATFPGNGVATVFPLPFRFFFNSEIQAGLLTNATGELTPLTLGTHYSLAGAGLPEVDGNAASVLTMLAAPSALQSLYVQRVMPISQPTDIVNQGKFLPEIHENVFDRLTMLIQQANGESKGAIRVAIGDPEPARLPPALSRANQLMGFDSSGDPIAVSPVSGSLEDFAIRLANDSDPEQGAGMVGYSGMTVADALDDISDTVPIPSLAAAVFPGSAVDAAVLRYSASSVLAPAAYRKVAAEPTHSLKFQATSGDWFEIAERRITPRMAGALYDGTTDDSAAILRACAACVATGADLDLEDGRALCGSTIALPINCTIHGGDVALDFSAATLARAVHAEGRAWVVLPALSSSPAIASRSLVFDSAHGLAVNDVIGIRNPTDGSFNAVDPVGRAYYRAGEMCLVKEVVSSTEILLWEPLLSAYSHSVVTMHKLPGDTISFNVARLTILAGPSVTTGIEFTRLRDASHDNITVLGSQRQAMYRTNCYNISGSNLVCRQSILSGAGLDYGLVDGSCHKTYAHGEFFGQRHGYVGGNGGDLTLPCRFMRADGIFANSSPTAQTLGAFNAHGNCEFYEIHGEFHNGGVQFGGDHGKASGRVFLAGSGKSAVCGTECLGTDYDASGLHISAPESAPDALIRFITSAVGSWTVRGGKVNLKDVTVRAPLAPGLLTFAVASGRVSPDPILVDISGMVVFDLAAAATATISTSGANPVERIISRDAKSYDAITWATGSTTVVGTLP